MPETRPPMLISRWCERCGLQYAETVQPTGHSQWHSCPRCGSYYTEPEQDEK